jgi:hypothetical protein
MNKEIQMKGGYAQLVGSVAQFSITDVWLFGLLGTWIHISLFPYGFTFNANANSRFHNYNT